MKFKIEIPLIHKCSRQYALIGLVDLPEWAISHSGLIVSLGLPWMMEMKTVAVRIGEVVIADGSPEVILKVRETDSRDLGLSFNDDPTATVRLYNTSPNQWRIVSR